jgi:hypothetical protein
MATREEEAKKKRDQVDGKTAVGAYHGRSPWPSTEAYHRRSFRNSWCRWRGWHEVEDDDAKTRVTCSEKTVGQVN